VAAWFDAPSGGGGFLDTVYGGSASPAGPFAVGDGAAVAFGVTAADPGIRDTLEALSMAALVDGGAFAGQTAARSQITRLSGEALLSAEGRLTELRAGVGQVEAALASAAARIAAEDTATALARASILAADPYATATALTDAESRLETLYTLTARLSRLSFAEYLR
jgi:flagellar hook-associated protein 3 FlgL